jgi:hypothetical protein
MDRNPLLFLIHIPILQLQEFYQSRMYNIKKILKKFFADCVSESIGKTPKKYLYKH